MRGDDGRYRPSNTISSVQANYHFAYSVDNHATGDVKRHSETRKGNHVHGSYFVLEPDGGQRLVEYTADENGFRPHVQRRYSRHVPAPYKNYHVNLNDAKRFYPAERQGLHTQILTRLNTQPARLSSIQQREFEKLLLKAQNGLNANANTNQDRRGLDWTVDDRYSKPTFSGTTHRIFHQRAQPRVLPQQVYNVKRTNYPLIRNQAQSVQRQNTAKEAIYSFDIKRAVPENVFKPNGGNRF